MMTRTPALDGSIDGFSVTTLSVSARPLVLVRGPLDMRTALSVEGAIDAATLPNGTPEVLVDVSGVSFCDARGAAALVHRRAGGPQVLVNGASPRLRSMCALLAA